MKSSPVSKSVTARVSVRITDRLGYTESRDPNRHLKGAFSLASQFQNFLDHPSGGLLHSGFWNYLREDITFSLFRNCALKINLDPVPAPGNVSSDQDRLNSISLILGRIINAMIGSTSEMAGGTWEAMWSYVKDWLSGSPAHFQPFSRAALPSLSRLPTVHMLKSCQGKLKLLAITCSSKIELRLTLNSCITALYSSVFRYTSNTCSKYPGSQRLNLLYLKYRSSRRYS